MKEALEVILWGDKYSIESLEASDRPSDEADMALERGALEAEL